MVCRAVVVLGLVCATTQVAAAEDLYERLWPELPSHDGLTLSQQITDQLTELGNVVGTHVTTLSKETIALNFDGRRRRAKIRLGLTDEGNRYLTFKLASDVHFTQGIARFSTRIDVGVAGRVLHLELPEFEMAPSEYHGERGVLVRVPLFKRTF